MGALTLLALSAMGSLLSSLFCMLEIVSQSPLMFGSYSLAAICTLRGAYLASLIDCHTTNDLDHQVDCDRASNLLPSQPVEYGSVSVIMVRDVGDDSIQG